MILAGSLPSASVLHAGNSLQKRATKANRSRPNSLGLSRVIFFHGSSHPTVPPPTSLILRAALPCGPNVYRCSVYPCLPSPRHSPTIPEIALRGIRDNGPVREFTVRFDAGGGGCDVAGREPGLYPRTAASLLRRCDATVRRVRSRRRPHHRLHDPEKIPALAGLPG